MENQADEVSWPKKPLSELCDEITVGFVGSMTRHYVEHGVPFLRSKDVKPYRIQLSELVHISKDFHMRISKSRLRPGDVVIVRTGAPGTAARIPAAIKEANCADLVIARPSRRLDGTFLVYYLNYAAKSHVSQFAVGAVQQHLNVGAVESLRVPFPPMSEQKAIASILGSLDDKIDLNRQMNETLESMARALYKSWFVEFDPVVAKAAGKRPFGMDDATAALFPDRFVDSELGPIPEGWEVMSLEQIADVRWGDTSVTKKSYTENGYVAFSAKGPDGRLPYYDYDCHGVVLSAIGANCGMTWFAQGRWSCIKNTIRILPTADGPPAEFLYYATNDPSVWPIRGSAQPFISQGDARQIRLLVPTNGVLERFGALSRDWIALTHHNFKESRTLAQLRDLLLPKLLSGEIRIKDAEKVAQEAG